MPNAGAPASPEPQPAPPAPAAPGAAAGSNVRRLLRILRFARPHRPLLVLSFVLMAAQAIAGTARLILIYPIITRVFRVAETTVPPPQAADASREKSADEMEQLAKRTRDRAGPIGRVFDGIVDLGNSLTEVLVPDSWVLSARDPYEALAAQEARREREALAAAAAAPAAAARAAAEVEARLAREARDVRVREGCATATRRSGPSSSCSSC